MKIVLAKQVGKQSGSFVISKHDMILTSQPKALLFILNHGGSSTCHLVHVVEAKSRSNAVVIMRKGSGTSPGDNNRKENESQHYWHGLPVRLGCLVGQSDQRVM